MKLTVKNFGPIQKATVDIKPMTVFVGHSNTGKSYLAILIYITAKVLESPFSVLDITRINDDLSDKTVADEKELAKFVNTKFLDFVNTIHRRWENEALRCFGEEWKEMINKNGGSTSIIVSSNDKKITLDMLSPNKDKFSLKNPILQNVKKKISPLSKRDSVDYFDIARLVVSEGCSLFNSLLTASEKKKDSNYLRRRYISEGFNTHYLPAVRGGLMQSHRILVSALVDRAPTIGLTGAEIIPFTGVLADFLQKLLNVHAIQRRKPKAENISELSQTIEQDIMHGNIEVKMLATRYPDFRYKFKDRDVGQRNISLMNASSSVSELAPIALFIRYYLSPGDIFIVEEPEAHLHPEAQRVIAGILVELVNAGVYVIATTHSDIILEQISNFVHADKFPNSKVLNKRVKNLTLQKNKIGTYGFKRSKNGNGTIVNRISFNKETGILTKDHLDVSSDLYNETVDLFNQREINDA